MSAATVFPRSLLAALARAVGADRRRCPACGHALAEGGALCPDCARALAPEAQGCCPMCGARYSSAYGPRGAAEEASAPALESDAGAAPGAVVASGPATICAPVGEPDPGPAVTWPGILFDVAACESAHLCGACRLAPRSWTRLAFHGPYDGDLREHILHFKLHRDLGRQHLLGALLAGAYACAFLAAPPLPGPTAPEPDGPVAPVAHDLVVPVPLHAARLRWRGFNQSLELARTMLRVLAATARRHPGAARAPLPRLAPHLLARVRHTTPQTSLPLAERQTNLKNAFAATDPSALRGKRILVVDDVATTCSTLHETARTLLRAGAARVDALVLARTQDRR